MPRWDVMFSLVAMAMLNTERNEGKDGKTALLLLLSVISREKRECLLDKTSRFKDAVACLNERKPHND